MIQVSSHVARPIAAEDIRVGDHVALMQITFEFPPYFWCPADTTLLPPDQPVRIDWQTYQVGVPFKIRAICLPFIFVKAPDKTHEFLDVRRCSLAKLDDEYSRTVWQTYAKRRKKSRKSGRKK